MSLAALDKRAAALEAQRRAQGWVPEIERILNLPRALNTEAAGVSLVAPWTKRWALPGKVHDLRPIQALALATLAGQPAPLGLFGVIGVGHGKTLIVLLAAQATGAQRPVVLMHPDMEAQFWRDVKFWQKQYDIKIPTVVPYSRLSMAENAELLDELDPDLVIVDECQALRHPGSARTKRVLRFGRKHPGCRWVMLSGTTTSKSLSDYAHLLELALRHQSPLPLKRHDLDLWCSVVDVGGMPDQDAVTAMMPLVKAEGIPHSAYHLADVEARRALCRRALHSRQSTTPGVISTETMSLNARLVLTRRLLPPVREISMALRELERTWTRPDGEEITDAARFAAISRQLSAGFYYRWLWPDGEEDAEWLEARNEWNRQVRHALRYASGVGHDSPLLVSNRCKRASEGRGRVPQARLDAWLDWQCQKHKDPPPREAVWITETILDDVMDWVAERDSGLIWYMHDAVGQALAARGLPVFGSGTDAPPATTPFAAVSIPVHHKGKNLQAWSDQLLVENPSGGQIMEQLLGRTHRQGQTASVIRATWLGHTASNRKAMNSACTDALYIEQTQGIPQKLNACEWATDVPPWLL